MSQHDCCEPWYQCDTFTYGDAVARPIALKASETVKCWKL